MTAQFWIGDFFIDLTRNQITRNQQSQTMAPKALAVLAYMAQHQGKVVSQDELLTQVWQDTAVTPNTLQKSIAQIRKAFGDDGKGQAIIKTHAKQGYSLEWDVRWQPESESALEKLVTNADNEPLPEAAEKIQQPEQGRKHRRPGLIFASFLAGVFVVGIFGFSSLRHSDLPGAGEKITVTEIRQVTATDNKEVDGIYSPDGRYIVFNRYSEAVCRNNIWAKDTQTQQEYQLTQNLAIYGSHSFSPDGKELVFIQSQNCSQPINQKKCYQLLSLNFEQALRSPQAPRVLMECKNSAIRDPIWLNNGDIAIQQKHEHRWQLTGYSITEEQSHVIYAMDEGNLINHAYSPALDIIGLTSIHGDGKYYIELIKPDGQLLSSHPIQYPDNIPKFRRIFANFSPIDDQLIFSTGRRLFTLSDTGEINNISLPLDESIGSPVFHPDKKRALVIKGSYDSDVAKVSLAQLASNQPLADYQVLERSVKGEDNALFHPTQDMIAFSSGRSGERQVWLKQGDSSQQLSHFPIDTYFSGMDWAADGHSLLVNAVHQLTQVFLDGTHKPIDLPYPVVQLFDWDSQQQTALVNLRIRGVLKFAEVNLANASVRMLKQREVNWALKSQDGRLVYMDHMDRFWQRGSVEDLHIAALDGQGSDKRFVIRDSVIFGVNDDFQLWSYDLDSQDFATLGTVSSKIDAISDINQTDILMSVFISGKKEVAELVLQ